MRNDRVLIPVLHVAHDAKCFPPCVYSYFHRQLSDKFILSFGLYEYKKEGSGWFNRNGASPRSNYNLS